MKHLKVLFVVLFVGVLSVPLPAKEVRSRINLNREWKFTLGDPEGAQHLDFADAEWESVSLPHSFSLPYFMWKKVYNGYGWYRKEIEVPARWMDQSVTLEFDGAFIEAEVYVNGVHLGTHVGGYTGFFFELSDYLKEGSNQIAVRINNHWNPRVAPRAGDHQFSGGIYRSVWLNVTDKVHVGCNGTFIYTPQVSGSFAVCEAQTEIRNNSGEDKQCTVQTEIVAPDGKTVASVQSTAWIKKSGVTLLTQTLPSFRNPLLWSPETPHLYTAVTTVSSQEKVRDRHETKFGIRWFEWTADRGFFLNGAPYYLLGANVHQDQAGWGDAVTHAAMRRDVQLMKDAGFNCIRGSHYPHDPAFSQGCDEIGLILFQENAFWGMGGSSGDRGGWGPPSSSCYPPNPSDQPYFDASVLGQLKEMIKIHRNHASIAAWSLCNEPFFTDNSTDEAMKNLLNLATDSARKWDPTREVAIGGAQRKEVDRLGKNAIAFYNGDGATLYPNPGFPNLVSEYGSTTSQRPGAFAPGWGSLGDGFVHPIWRSGQIIWCGFDHGTIGGEGLATMGMVDYFRIPKRQYYWYQQAYVQGKRPPVEPEWPAAGIPARLKLEASNTVLKSTQGMDDAQLVVTVLDASGSHISHNVPVELSIVSGPGEFPTGTKIQFLPPSREEASDIAIRDGQAAIAFRSYYGGKAVIQATSPGLQPDTLVLTIEGTPVWVEGVTPKVKDRPYKRHIGQETSVKSSEMLLAKNRPSWASSTRSGTSKVHVNDDDRKTIWEPTATDKDKSWTLSLEATYSVNRIRIEFPTADAYQYTIAVSKDEKEWTTVVDQTRNRDKEKVQLAYGNLGKDIAFIRIQFTSDPAGLAEVQVGGAPTLPEKPHLLSGIVIGTNGSWQGNGEATREAAMDLNTSTFFDGPEGSPPCWGGLDLGQENQKPLKRVVFVPRSGHADRMLGGCFQVANQPDFSDAVTVYTIEVQPQNGVNSVKLSNRLTGRYVRYLSTASGNGNVAEVEFYSQ